MRWAIATSFAVRTHMITRVVLTREALEQRMRTGEVSVTYAFDPTLSPPRPLDPPQAVDPDDPSKTATRIFVADFFGERLSLTLGPLVLSHRYRSRRRRKRYKDRPAIFDLRETKDSIQIQPGESITINAIEHVTFGGNTAALTLPRLTHSTAGIVLASSYVDAYWDGILVLQLTNQSARPIKLRFGEKFATMFFFSLEGSPVPDAIRQAFPQKSHHYGLSWSRILTSDADPFPLRKSHEPGRLDSVGATFTEGATRYWKRILALGIVPALVTAVFFLGQLREQLHRVERVEQDQKQLSDTVRNLSSSVAHGLRAGTAVVDIFPNQQEGSVLIPLSGLKADQSYTPIVVVERPTRGVTATAEVVTSTEPGPIKLHLGVLLSEPAASPTTVILRWIVA